MAQLSNSLKYKLEQLFDMRSGYVMDFTNATFADFVKTSIGFDPYERYSGSKAQILRQVWDCEPVESVQRLTLELLDRCETLLLSNDGMTPGDQKLLEQAKAEVAALAIRSEESAADLQFLQKDFGSLDLTRVSVPVGFQEVVRQRLDEIDRCLRAEAPLAVIFLCGSTLEGLLFEVATKNAERFNKCRSAPKGRDVTVKSFGQWTLNDLIVTAREIGIVGEDVAKHAHAVRDFRNYIHPRQQISENFSPRMFTARMAHQVLSAALSDLASRAD